LNIQTGSLDMCTVYGYSNSQCDIASPLQEHACYMKSRSVTCHPAEVTFPLYSQPKLLLDLAPRTNARLSWPTHCSKGAVPKSPCPRLHITVSPKGRQQTKLRHNYVKNQPIFLIISLICSKVVDNGLGSICRTRRYTTL